MDVYFYEVFQEEKDALERFWPKDIPAHFDARTIQESGQIHAPASIISTRTQSIFPSSWTPDTKAIFSRSKGYDHFDELRNTDIVLGSLKSYCSRSVAEHAVMVMFALLKKLPQQFQQFATFDRDGLTGHDVFAKNALVVGVGDIGIEIVRLCKALGMHVKGVDIIPDKSECDYVSLGEGLAWANVIFVALPLTEETQGLLHANQLRQSGKGAIVINISRGEITPLEDLKRLLDEEHLEGVGLDVYENESVIANDLRAGNSSEATKILQQWQKDSRVICTPHNAFNSQEALEHKARMTVEAIRIFLEKGIFYS